MTKAKASLALLLAISASAAVGKEKVPPESPALYKQLASCRTIADANARLQCFDKAAAELDSAVARNEVFMVDKQQVQKTRRTLFGLPLPNLGLFGGGDDNDNSENQVTELESTVKSASYNGEAWVITIVEGSTWQQTDFSPLALSPKPGMAVVIKRAALGTYKMSVRKQPAIKVKRIY